jgi:hypothetical protein
MVSPLIHLICEDGFYAEELFWEGWCTEEQLEWGPVLEEFYYKMNFEGSDLDVDDDDALFEFTRGCYQPTILHVWGRFVDVSELDWFNTGDLDSVWDWQRVEPEDLTGWIKCSALINLYDIQRRRLTRKRDKAMLRGLFNIIPRSEFSPNSLSDKGYDCHLKGVHFKLRNMKQTCNYAFFEREFDHIYKDDLPIIQGFVDRAKAEGKLR